MRIFILEDNQERIESFKQWLSNHILEITDNVEDAKNIIETQDPFDIYFLDHDLDNRVYVDSNEENTGYQLAKYLEEKEIKARFITHSFNPVGAMAICNTLVGCQLMPFQSYNFKELLKSLREVH